MSNKPKITKDEWLKKLKDKKAKKKSSEVVLEVQSGKIGGRIGFKK